MPPKSSPRAGASPRGGASPRLPAKPFVSRLKVVGEPLQLIKVTPSRTEKTMWHFQVGEEALRKLEGYGERAVMACTVCGPYRSGKSFLMNLLLGADRSRSFKVDSTLKSVTQGLWMWEAEEIGGEYVKGGPGGDFGALLFLDCEGFGSTDSDQDRDAKLMALCLLLSSVLLMNTKGVLSEGLFKELSLVSHLSKHISDFEGGSEFLTKPALLWLIRDFMLDLKDERGLDLTTDDYLEKALRAQPLSGPNSERSKAAMEVREHMLKYFTTRKCMTLVQPVIDEEQLQSLMQVPQEQMRAEFVDQLRHVQDAIIEMARNTPKAVGNFKLGGADLALLLKKHCEAINSGQTMSVHGTWTNYQRNVCDDLAKRIRDRVTDVVSQVGDGRQGPPLPLGRSLPVSEEMLGQMFAEERKAARKEWNTYAVADRDVKEEYWQELLLDLSQLEQALQRRNAEVADCVLKEAVDKWSEWMLSPGKAEANDPRARGLTELFERGLPFEPAARAAREAIWRAQHARLQWGGHAAPKSLWQRTVGRCCGGGSTSDAA